ncbi:MAG: hypothetical protein K5663_04180 [Clostridiales bacterium]|nr:hypothetical protein [Clostridiales bacterium]
MPEQIKRKAKSAKSGKNKKARRKQSFFRRFFRGLGRVFNLYYSFTTNPEEKENRIKPKLFGRAVTFAGFMVMMVALIVLVTLILNNRSVGVEHVNVVMAGLPDDFEGYKILVISDLNGRSFGQDQSTLMRRLGSESYNCVVFLGDMVGESGNTQPFYALINQLDGRRPMYFIAGDSDPVPVLDEPRESDGNLTLNEMVLDDWVLGAMELGCTYLDVPVKLTRGSSSLWLMPDTFLNLDLYKALDDYKSELEQVNESYLEGISVSRSALPLTTYRRNILYKSHDLIPQISDDDIIIMLSHEVPADSQLTRAQAAMTEEQKKRFFASPDLVLAGHYCGGEWKLPLIGTLYADSNILARYGWFPSEKYVQGLRSVDGLQVYTSQGLGNNSRTVLRGRLNNPPRVTIITLTGALPQSFLD